MPMMNEQTYQLVVANIRRYSMWLSVADPDWLQETLSCLGGDCNMGIVPSLLLMVDFPRGGYPQGQMLSIPFIILGLVTLWQGVKMDKQQQNKK